MERDAVSGLKKAKVEIRNSKFETGISMPRKINIVILSEAKDLGSWTATTHPFVQFVRLDQS